MRAVDIIVKKRDGGELTREEINYFVNCFTSGEIPDYQAAAWAMAVLLKGMTPRETTDLTLAMANSGECLDIAQIVPNMVDKHSTGGVGDKTTLVVQPIVAACGLAMGKMSGHGLGFSGGTLDKMESIPGFRTDLSKDEFIHQLKREGMVLTGQSADLAPADGKLYALRDVTGTVQSIPLIASSIMSKKLAAGARAILLDVKVGLGAFITTLEEAQELANLMVAIAHMAGRQATALISDMNQPLGCAVGNALELREAVDTLQGGGPVDFRQHCLTVSAHLLALGHLVGSVEQGMDYAQTVLDSGQAWDRFRRLVTVQRGDVSVIDRSERLPQAGWIETITSQRSAYLAGVNARKIGEAVVSLGGGRSRKEDVVDHAVGVVVHHKVGDYVESGQALFTVHASSQVHLDHAREQVLQSHTWSDAPVPALPLFYAVIRGEEG